MKCRSILLNVIWLIWKNGNSIIFYNKPVCANIEVITLCRLMILLTFPSEVFGPSWQHLDQMVSSWTQMEKT